LPAYDKKHNNSKRGREMKTFLLSVAAVLLQAGSAAAGFAAPVPVEAPALAPWGMVGTAAALGLSGLYFIIKRNK
jgi:hypothetical protein